MTSSLPIPPSTPALLNLLSEETTDEKRRRFQKRVEKSLIIIHPAAPTSSTAGPLTATPRPSRLLKRR